MREYSVREVCLLDVQCWAARGSIILPAVCATVVGLTGLAAALELDWLVDHVLAVCVMDARRLEAWRMCLPPEVCSMVA